MGNTSHESQKVTVEGRMFSGDVDPENQRVSMPESRPGGDSRCVFTITKLD